jgi:hypothetical protein
MAVTGASVDQAESIRQVEAEQGSLDRANTGEAERRRRRSRCHGGGCALVVGNDGEGFLQLEGSTEG